MELLEVGGGPGLQPGVVGVGRVLLVLQLPLDLVPHLVLPLQGEGHQLVPEHTQGHVQYLFKNVFYVEEYISTIKILVQSSLTIKLQ